MGYHPEILAFSFPPYPRGGTSLLNHPKPWNLARFLYRFKPWIGFDIWHMDPERAVEGQRRDDSCGWFPRNLTPELRRAVDEFCGPCYEDERRMIEKAQMAAAPYDVRYPSLKRMAPGDCFALTLMTLSLLDRIAFKRWEPRWWQRDPMPLIVRLATRLSMNPTDDLAGVIENPGQFVRLVAAAYRRALRPWWKHPRWHVHHWKVNFDLSRNLRRMFERCGTCRKRLGFAYCPTNPGDGTLHHSECLGIRAASVRAA